MPKNVTSITEIIVVYYL